MSGEWADFGAIRIRGRDYSIQIGPGNPRDAGLPRYRLHGVRGAIYETVRNVNDRHAMFLVSGRRFGIPAGMDGVWLTDRDGAVVVARS